MKRMNIVILLLGISLLANGFFASVLLSKPRFTPPPSPLTRMEQALKVLDANEQATVRKILEQHRPNFDAQTSTMREKIARIHGIVTAPHLDKKALTDAFASGTKRDSMRQNMASLFMDIATSLPDASRIAFFNAAAPAAPASR